MALILKSNRSLVINKDVFAAVEAYKRRVIADGGTIMKEEEIARAFDFIYKTGLTAGNIISFVSPDFAVQFSENSNEVYKLYSLFGDDGRADMFNSSVGANMIRLVEGDNNSLESSPDNLDKQTYAISSVPLTGNQTSVLFGGRNERISSTGLITYGALLIGETSLTANNITVEGTVDDTVNFKAINNNTVFASNRAVQPATKPNSFAYYLQGNKVIGFVNGGKLLDLPYPDYSIAEVLSGGRAWVYAPGGRGRSSLPQQRMGTTIAAVDVSPEQAEAIAEYLNN